jgi:hypothetical protein
MRPSLLRAYEAIAAEGIYEGNRCLLVHGGSYILSVDGTVAAYRLPALLAGDSAVLLPASPWREHFYAELVPWEHYIPVPARASCV